MQMNLYTKFLFFIFICVVTSKTKCCTKYTVNSPYVGPGAATTSGPVTLTTENLLRSGPGSAVISVKQGSRNRVWNLCRSSVAAISQTRFQPFIFVQRCIFSQKICLQFLGAINVASQMAKLSSRNGDSTAVDRQIIQQLQCLR